MIVIKVYLEWVGLFSMRKFLCQLLVKSSSMFETLKNMYHVSIPSEAGWLQKMKKVVSDL